MKNAGLKATIIIKMVQVEAYADQLVIVARDIESLKVTLKKIINKRRPEREEPQTIFFFAVYL